jgi:hypothetical protein
MSFTVSLGTFTEDFTQYSIVFFMYAFCGFDVSSSPPSLDFIAPVTSSGVFVQG